ncbi:hypothetical protein VTJ04DRAFT_1697 [Mycothermus thermophilus]|uniref:uncharacterized protein n=1 Tax=Humicola insolens TaxID=85995 RepID=UPI0037449CAE
MDHSSHDHHDHHDHHQMMMDHSGHGDMGGGGHMCNMNMLFTWDTTDLCIVFRQWHISSTFGLLVSLVAVVVICAGYEALREGIRRYDAALARRVETAPLPQSHTPEPRYSDQDNHENENENEPATEPTHPLLPSTGHSRELIYRRAHVTKAVLYGIQNFYAFMIMLIFMTYNGWVMLAVSFGAGIGYLVFGGSTPVTKETACH